MLVIGGDEGQLIEAQRRDFDIAFATLSQLNNASVTRIPVLGEKLEIRNQPRLHPQNA